MPVTHITTMTDIERLTRAVDRQEHIIRLEQRVQKAEREVRRCREALAAARFHADAVSVVVEFTHRRRKGVVG